MTVNQNEVKRKKHKYYPCVRVDGKVVREHVKIMQDHIGRSLEPYEKVYHRNGDPLDNRIDNLVIIEKHSITHECTPRRKRGIKSKKSKEQ